MHFLFFVLIVIFNASATPDAIYGQDNRQDVYAVSNPLFINLAKTTAAMIERTKIKDIGNSSVFSGTPLKDMFKLCPDQRFRNQPSAANCSGTLVADDIIMTAAHCYDLAKSICKNYVWVFDFKVLHEDQASVTVSNDNIYECSEVILKEMNIKVGIDHALIKLKRKVTDRSYAKLRSKRTLELNSPLVLIGHPSGLPTKIADDAYVLKILENSYVTNLDAFSINSGSGVFNAETGDLEGILSSGRADYDGKGNCTSVKTYVMEEGNETVVDVRLVKEFLSQYKK